MQDGATLPGGAVRLLRAFGPGLVALTLVLISGTIAWLSRQGACRDRAFTQEQRASAVPRLNVKLTITH